MRKEFLVSGGTMARKPKKAEGDSPVDRVIPIPAWVYNLMIDVAGEQRRDVRSQIVFELEQVARKYRKEREKKDTPGNSAALPLAA
jgi:hypothetical protein